MAPKNFLNNITIPAPCTTDWDSMIGNDQVRFCEHCSLDVHNLSLLTRNQAQRLVTRSKGAPLHSLSSRIDGPADNATSGAKAPPHRPPRITNRCRSFHRHSERHQCSGSELGKFAAR